MDQPSPTAETTNTPELHGRNKLISIGELGTSTASNQPAFDMPINIEAIQLSETAVAVSPFIDNVEHCFFHYVKGIGYVLCNGEDCLLCKTGIKVDQRYLVPVYELVEEQIAVLPISLAEKPTSLLPQIKPYLVQVGINISIRKQGYTYSVDTKPLPAGVTLDKDKIDKFQRAYKSGQVALSSIYRTMTNDELRDTPQIQRTLLLEGVA